jgi:hypothetical protein
MPEVEYTYRQDDIEALFKKEEELMERIQPFCLETNKHIQIEYCISTTCPFFTLKIIITHEE